MNRGSLREKSDRSNHKQNAREYGGSQRHDLQMLQFISLVQNWLTHPLTSQTADRVCGRAPSRARAIPIIPNHNTPTASLRPDDGLKTATDQESAVHLCDLLKFLANLFHFIL